MLRSVEERLKKPFPYKFNRPEETLVGLAEISEKKIAITRQDIKFLTPLIHELASGRIYGTDTLLSIVVVSPKGDPNILKPLISLCSLAGYPCLKDLRFTNEFKDALTDASVLIVKLEPYEEKIATREKLIAKEFSFFRDLGLGINEFCDKYLRVVLIGEGCTDFAYIMSKFMVLVPPACITGLVRHYQRRAEAKLANRLKKPVCDIKNVFVWGESIVDVSLSTVRSELKPFSRTKMEDIEKLNENLYLHATSFPEDSSTDEENEDEEEIPSDSIPQILQDEIWIQEEFNKFVTEDIDHRAHYSLVSALAEHLKAFEEGSNELNSMIVSAAGFYGWTQGYAALPVTINEDFNASVEACVTRGMVTNIKLEMFKQDQAKRYKMIDQMAAQDIIQIFPPRSESDSLGIDLHMPQAKVSLVERLSTRPMEGLEQINMGEGYETEINESNTASEISLGEEQSDDN